MDNKTILIVGRSGNGKTSLAESISGLRDCNLYNPDKEHTSNPYLQVKQYNGTRFNVLDCSCIGDSEEDAGYSFNTIERVAKDTIEKVEKGGGIDAVVFAMKYGVRFTKQESDAVDVVKRLFGEFVFAKRIVIVFSYGDLFDTDDDFENHKAFDVWCRQQQGSIKKLFEDVNYRCVLFDNKAKCHDESLKQLELFIKIMANKDKDFKLQVVPTQEDLDNGQWKQRKSQEKEQKKKHKNPKADKQIEEPRKREEQEKKKRDNEEKEQKKREKEKIKLGENKKNKLEVTTNKTSRDLAKGGVEWFSCVSRGKSKSKPVCGSHI